MVMEKALLREGSAGCWRESRIYPPLALAGGAPSAGTELNCACAACTCSRRESMKRNELRRDMMVSHCGKGAASISSFFCSLGMTKGGRRFPGFHTGRESHFERMRA